MNDGPEKQRVDKWLWHARFFKSRSLAAAAVETCIRVDGTKVSKPSRTVSPGDTLTFTMRGGMVHLMGKNGTMANVTQADVMQSNGVIHVVDGVLLPSM